MNDADRIAELEAALENKKEEIPYVIKFGNKRNVVFSSRDGLKQRHPVTLYAPGWLFLCDHAEEIRQFVLENRDQLSWER